MFVASKELFVAACGFLIFHASFIVLLLPLHFHSKPIKSNPILCNAYNRLASNTMLSTPLLIQFNSMWMVDDVLLSYPFVAYGAAFLSFAYCLALSMDRQLKPSTFTALGNRSFGRVVEPVGAFFPLQCTNTATATC